VTVTAEGIGSLVQWSAPLLDFDNMIVGVQSPRQDAYFRNIGNSNLTITLIEIVGDDFIFVDLVPSTLSLPPNAEKIFWVWFKPTTAGQRQGSLRVHTDAPGSPHTLELKGVAFNHA
jgi:hypothetical protein